MKRRPMPVVFPLGDLPDSLVVQVLQKTRPVPFARLRRSTKWLDTVAEDNRRYIGILLHRLDIIQLMIEDRFGDKSNDFVPEAQLLFTISKQAKLSKQMDMTIFEACKKLSGFSFRHVQTTDIDFVNLSDVDVYYNFLRQQCWRTKTVECWNTPAEILAIIKPNFLKVTDVNDMRNIPKSVETLEVSDSSLPIDMKGIAGHVKNFIVVPWKQCHVNESCLLSFIEQIARAFYNDELPVSYAQLQHLYFNDVTIVHISKPDSTTAATELLTHYLQKTSYRGETIISTHKFYHSNRYPVDKKYLLPSSVQFSTMVDVFPITDLPVPLVVQVLQKTAPVSFVRLRRATRWLDQVAEKHRRCIAIPLYRIDIAAFQCRGIPVSDDEEELNNPYRYISPKQIAIDVDKTADEWSCQYLYLSNIYKQLSGFTFRQVLTGHKLLDHATTHMKPSVLSSYMDFLQKQRWCTRSATSDGTSIEILDIIRPKMLKVMDNNVSNIPKSVKTIEVQKVHGGGLPNIRAISNHVENFLVNLGVIARYEYCLPSFIQQVVSAFHEDELPVSYAQLKNLYFEDATVVHIPYLDDTMAAMRLLTHYLIGTPYETSQIVSAHKFYHTIHGAKNKKRVTVANVNLTSKGNKPGLLAVRTDVYYKARGNFDLLEVSVYFWKDRQQYLGAAREGYEKESTGIRV